MFERIRKTVAMCRLLVELCGPLPVCGDRCPWDGQAKCHRPPRHPQVDHWSRSGETWHDWDRGLAALIREGAAGE